MNRATLAILVLDQHIKSDTVIFFVRFYVLHKSQMAFKPLCDLSFAAVRT